MTIDEAISHAREVAECQKMSARLIEDNAYIPESVDKEAITYGNTICANEHEKLAEWLEELKQYRAIGTPEECQTAMEKQKKKKPVTYKGTNIADCPICGATVRGISKPFGDWCSNCGQKLDWSDGE